MVYQGTGSIDDVPTANIPIGRRTIKIPIGRGSDLPMKELMPASEARRIVDNCEDEKTTRLWNEIVDKVNQAIQNGERCYTSDGSLPQSLIKKLQALGYKAYNGSQYNQEYYVISWKEAK